MGLHEIRLFSLCTWEVPPSPPGILADAAYTSLFICLVVCCRYLWFFMEPIMVKAENYSFLKKLVETVKQAKDAQDPDNEEANHVRSERVLLNVMAKLSGGEWGEWSWWGVGRGIILTNSYYTCGQLWHFVAFTAVIRLSIQESKTICHSYFPLVFPLPVSILGIILPVGILYASLQP